jgi:hypothetical protein
VCRRGGPVTLACRGGETDQIDQSNADLRLIFGILIDLSRNSLV